jgi:hypothetical protein
MADESDHRGALVGTETVDGLRPGDPGRCGF